MIITTRIRGRQHRPGMTLFQLLSLPALLAGGLLSASAWAFTVNVVGVDKAGNEHPVSGFKWLLEEDNTHPPRPGEHLPVDTAEVRNNTLSISLHKSHAPVVASGRSDGSSTAISTISLPGSPVPVSLPPGRYFVSVLPDGEHSSCSGAYDMGGSGIDTSQSDSVTVYARQNPIETAQISIKVFHDIAPLNNAPDLTEPGLAGFTITLTDQSGGDIVQDAFGNKLGTTYQLDGNGDYILDGDCQPVIATVGIGDFVTPASGEVIIKNLTPGKYGVQVEPPGPDCITSPNGCWRQTTTIEGTHTIDAWVRPREPPFLVEFGPPFWHAFYGFVKPLDNLPAGGTGTITGQVAKGHLSAPPDIVFHPGPPPEGEGIGERCLVGLNALETGVPEAVWVGLCEDGTGRFTINNVRPGTYQLVIWDVSLLQIISFNTVIVPEGGGLVDAGTIPVPMWFGQQEHHVYYDGNGNGVRDPGEAGIPDQNVNLRFRDGTIYQAFPTDTSGFVPFQEVFPFFHWLTAEVDFARFKATGLTVTNDKGGPVTHDENGEGKRSPQVESRSGPVLVQAFQTFAGQNQRFEWGKTNYGPGENGGISGIVFYATTRAENDPRFAAGETWEPGIPRVQVNLYKDVVCNSNGGPAVSPGCPEATPGEVGDGQPDPGNPLLATYPHVARAPDVDNHPLGWADGGAMGPEDMDNNTDANGGQTGVFDYGDAVRVAWTDSWDDNLPEGCADHSAGNPAVIHGTPVPIGQCAEGLRTWNQVRPGVFDGGYAFGPHVTGDATEPELPAGTYIVETVTPPGYKLVKEEDRNVDFGITPIPAILPAKCVGAEREVPPLFSFLTRDGSGTLAQALPGVDPGDPDNAAPFAGDTRPLCDRKKVDLGSGQNAAADFFLFTDVPKAARAVGLITDDFANELAPGKPSFTEKFSPPWMPIAVFDYTGKEIYRTAGDEFGAYNFMAASTYTINPPTPSGVGPKMHHFCLNHPGPIPDGNGGFVTDPRFRPQYSTTCYTFNFEPGRTTYLDTPVIRTAAFVGALQTTLDCELPNGTPVIRDVLNMEAMAGAPAYIQGNGDTFTITSAGTVDVPNPAYPGGTLGNPADPPAEPEFVPRDYGFGNSEGTVCVGTYCFAADRVAWSNGAITVDVPNNAVGQGLATGQLTVIKAGGERTLAGVTLTVGATEPASMAIHRVGPNQSIQAAIDAADADDLILIDPGVYRELPILYKRVRIQGAGAWSTLIDAKHFSANPPNPAEAWRQKLNTLVGLGMIGLLPEQNPSVPDFFLKDGEAPGIFVSPNPASADGNFAAGAAARIDGLSIQGADLGGAVYVNVYADRLQLSNLRLINNAGNLAGGIRVGNPTVVAFARGGVAVETSPNPSIRIRNNHLLENGSYSTGGGISLYKGAADYLIERNNFCGNFSRSGGGAIAHRGLSGNGTIIRNDILFNEVFQGDQPGAGLGVGGGGGGIEVAGDPDPAGGLTEGTGNVAITRNLIQGNLGGAADGGGIALRNVNGRDAQANPGQPNQWWTVTLSGNIIVNNVTGLGGGGIALQDAVRTTIQDNSIARNDSTATGVFAFGAGPANPSTPQDAGIVSRPLSTALAGLTGNAISVPVQLRRNILWENRSWYWWAGSAPALTFFGNLDLTPGLDCAPSCYLSGSPDPFTAAYANDLTTAAAADEGGNFVQVYYTPLGRTGNYTNPPGPPAQGTGANAGNVGASAP
jgi:hypothetical protein